jgi:hypothetical protein
MNHLDSEMNLTLVESAGTLPKRPAVAQKIGHHAAMVGVSYGWACLFNERQFG